MDPIRILIADDHPMFRLGIRTRLALEPEFDVVGEAATAAEAVDLAGTCDPHVILMDLNFKQGASGIDAIRRIHAIHPAIGILVVTMFEDDHVFVAIRAGARGYLLKDAEPEEAVRAIRAISNGEAIFSPGIAERVMHYFATQTEETADHPFPELTPREQDILTLLAKGYTNRAIAEQLCLSEKTIRNQVSAIYGKLQVADRASAIILARQKGLQ